MLSGLSLCRPAAVPRGQMTCFYSLRRLLLTCGIIRDCAPRKTREMDKLIEERQGRLRDDPVSARLGGDSDVLALAARAKKRVPKKNTR